VLKNALKTISTENLMGEQDSNVTLLMLHLSCGLAGQVMAGK